MTLPDEAAAAVTNSLAEESYRILRSRLDLSRLPKLSRDVTERVIQAHGDDRSHAGVPFLFVAPCCGKRAPSSAVSWRPYALRRRIDSPGPVKGVLRGAACGDLVVLAGMPHSTQAREF